MYFEFLILIRDYFRTLTLKVFLFEWTLPVAISTVVFTLFFFKGNISYYKDFRGSSLNLLGILIGFSITIITILTTGNSKNLNEIRKKQTEFKIGNEKVSLFKLLLINFTYSVIIEIVLVVILLISPTLTNNFKLGVSIKYVGFTLLVFAVLHVLLLTIRNLSDFYLILMKPEGVKGKGLEIKGQKKPEKPE